MWQRKQIFLTPGPSIFAAALAQIQADLRATDTQIASSLSSFIIVQGVAPLFWSSVSEVYGRKVC